MVVSVHNHAASHVPESDLRAAVVYRLLQASRWTHNKNTHLSVCELGNGDNTKALKKLHDRKFGKSKLISIQHYEDAPTSKCDVIVIGPESEQTLPQEKSRNYIICNGCRKNRQYATVDLYLHKNSVRYDINRSVASRLGIHFRSDALKFALNIRD